MKFLFLTIALLQLSSGFVSAGKKLTFPKGFLFGAATSAYQVEGGWDADGKGESIWDYITHEHTDLIADKSNGDIAADSYHNYEEDVELLADLGANHYRLSISWSRLLPNGTLDCLNEDAIYYYKTLFKLLHLKGIKPIVTLYDNDLPLALVKAGAWANEELIDVFGEYARLCFELFGDLVKHWITINNPELVALEGEKSKILDEKLKPGVTAYKISYVLLKAHAKAYHIYQKEFKEQQKGKISIAINSVYYKPLLDTILNKEAAERTFEFTVGWFAHPIFSKYGDYPKVMKERIAHRSHLEGCEKSRLPELTHEEIEYIKGTADFFALNTFTAKLVQYLPDIPISKPSYDSDLGTYTFFNPLWSKTVDKDIRVVPWSIRKAVKQIAKHYGDVKILITENGYPDKGAIKDKKRVKYIKEYLKNLLLAIHEDKVNVVGYTVWSLLDGFHDLHGYTLKYGLYHVDFKNETRCRIPKLSAKYYKHVIETKCPE